MPLNQKHVQPHARSCAACAFCLAVCLGAALLSGCAPQGTASSAPVPASPAASVSAASSAAAASSGTPAAQDAVLQAPAASATVCSNDTTTPWPLYAQPDTSSAVLGEVAHFDSLYVLAVQDGWAYGCWGNWAGWVQQSLLPTDPRFVWTLAMPEFLTPAQQVEFLRAAGMFKAYIAQNGGLALDSSDTRTVDAAGGDSTSASAQLTYCADTAFASYADYDAAMRSLFTDDYLGRKIEAQSSWPVCKEFDGKLYVIQGDRGTWYCNVESYTVTEQTDARIAFDVNFLYQTSVAAHRCSLPCVLVKGDDGAWRFDNFTSGDDDLRWMDAMGPDFDPWEGQQ